MKASKTSIKKVAENWYQCIVTLASGAIATGNGKTHLEALASAWTDARIISSLSK